MANNTLDEGGAVWTRKTVVAKMHCIAYCEGCGAVSLSIFAFLQPPTQPPPSSHADDINV
jgi:hypothetical protein